MVEYYFPCLELLYNAQNLRNLSIGCNVILSQFRDFCAGSCQTCPIFNFHSYHTILQLSAERKARIKISSKIVVFTIAPPTCLILVQLLRNLHQSISTDILQCLGHLEIFIFWIDGLVSEIMWFYTNALASKGGQVVGSLIFVSRLFYMSFIALGGSHCK